MSSPQDDAPEALVTSQDHYVDDAEYVLRHYNNKKRKKKPIKSIIIIVIIIKKKNTNASAV